MFIREYPSVRGEDLPDYCKKATWNIFHTYIDTLSHILIYEYTGYGV